MKKLKFWMLATMLMPTLVWATTNETVQENKMDTEDVSYGQLYVEDTPTNDKFPREVRFQLGTSVSDVHQEIYSYEFDFHKYLIPSIGLGVLVTGYTSRSLIDTSEVGTSGNETVTVLLHAPLHSEFFNVRFVPLRGFISLPSGNPLQLEVLFDAGLGVSTYPDLGSGPSLRTALSLEALLLRQMSLGFGLEEVIDQLGRVGAVNRMSALGFAGWKF